MATAQDDGLTSLARDIAEKAEKLGLAVYPGAVVGIGYASWSDSDDWEAFIEWAPKVGAKTLYLAVDSESRGFRERVLQASYVSDGGLVHTLSVIEQTTMAEDELQRVEDEKSARREDLEKRADEEGWGTKILADPRYLGAKSFRTRHAALETLLPEFDPSIRPHKDSGFIIHLHYQLDARVPAARDEVEQKILESLPTLARELQSENPEWDSWRVPTKVAAAKKYLADRFGHFTAAAAGDLARFRQRGT